MTDRHNKRGKHGGWKNCNPAIQARSSHFRLDSGGSISMKQCFSDKINTNPAVGLIRTLLVLGTPENCGCPLQKGYFSLTAQRKSKEGNEDFTCAFLNLTDSMSSSRSCKT